ncbi:Sec26p [Sugiyamaella lignohabitans]|uniref:Coatomer subunit beta n=1 Tax=Sugiyamaella lignohabitans TaxID=796027 RepID=A0A161HI75_9ASCO|nr:Sec26p [Sugiyamaella lignohabitans]ANB12107.1 Sec26p [Sugiyamaella lignohabitans]
MNLLEKGSDEKKIDAMKRILTIMLNGDPMPQLLMQIIRFVMPSRNKQLKKLLHFYWEICPKLGADGKLKQEMILVCNAIRNDLQHPNEYIRGATLRFLCKLREPDLLEPLIPSIRACLDHRHAYVRKNAVFTVYSIASHSADHLIPDATELIKIFLDNETDATCKRNAFIALSNLSRDDAFEFVQKNHTNISGLEELLQLAFIEFIRKDAQTHPELKNSYIKIIGEILESSSNTVVYDAANALTSLTSNASAIKTAASKFIDLAVKESDNNIKLIVLSIVDKLRIKNPGVLNDLTMDILLVLSSPDLDVRRKALELALSMVTSKNVDDVVRLFKKDLAKTVNNSGDFDKNTEYRQLLIQSIHTCAVKFGEVATSVVDLLLDFIGDFNSSSAVDVIAFVKEVVELYPKLRKSIVKRLLTTLNSDEVRSGSVYRGALWILGEYCLEETDIHDSWVHIRKSLGEIPILSTERNKLNGGNDGEEAADNAESGATTNGGTTHKKGPKVLADGTYASESAFTATDAKNLEKVKSSRPPLRALILDGNYFVAAVLAVTITKLVLRFNKVSNNDSHKNALRAEALLILTSILRVGESEIVSQKIDEDSADRVYSCIQALLDTNDAIDLAFLQDSHSAFKVLIDKQKKKQDEKNANEREKTATRVDSPVKFRQFARLEANNVSSENADASDEAALSAANDASSDKIASRLNRIVQLTGFSDPVYAEAYVIVHQFDIVLDVLLFNQTTETLQNLSVEFATLGDLKVVERPTTQNVGPQSFHSVQTTIKVSSADAGVIFGNIIYEGHTGSVNNVVIINDIHVDIMDYIKPGHCSETEFRTMWSEFEWENKVNISVTYPSLRGFLAYLLKNTNMTCLTTGALSDETDADGNYKDECQFLSANLHARSSFGEDALANLSIEKDASGKVTGHVRIRSKGQGLALSLGDRVAELQRKIKPSPLSK